LEAPQTDLLQRRLPHVRSVRPRLDHQLAFIAANLGAVELIGMAASGAKYGIMTAHFYWLGAIPAMPITSQGLRP
jgi:hypothetical protein